jgi:hypothetical protein
METEKMIFCVGYYCKFNNTSLIGKIACIKLVTEDGITELHIDYLDGTKGIQSPSELKYCDKTENELKLNMIKRELLK